MNHTASERSNTRYLERLRIDAEYVSRQTVDRQSANRFFGELFNIRLAARA